MAARKMNVKLLRKIAALIQERPKEFNMDVFGIGNHSCGTPHCIGGWAAVLTRKTLFIETREVMCLTHAEFDKLCYPDAWPKEFLTEETKRNWALISPKVAAARIEHFIATEGRE